MILVICKSCIKSFNFLKDTIKQNYGKTGLLKLINSLCRIFLKYSEAACDIYIGDYAPIIIDSLLDHYLNGEYICNFSIVCKYSHFEKLNADDYAKELLKDKPKNNPIIIKDNTKKWKVIHLTDMHTDLKYTEGSKGDCNDPTCCQPKDIIKLNNNIENKQKVIDLSSKKRRNLKFENYTFHNKTNKLSFCFDI